MNTKLAKNKMHNSSFSIMYKDFNSETSQLIQETFVPFPSIQPVKANSWQEVANFLQEEEGLLILELTRNSPRVEQLLQKVLASPVKGLLAIASRDESFSTIAKFTKLGAFDYLHHPLEQTRLIALALRAFEVQKQKAKDSLPSTILVDWNQLEALQESQKSDWGSGKKGGKRQSVVLPNLNLREARKILILEAMRRCKMNQTEAAKMLGFTRQALSQYLKKLDF